MSGVLRHHRSTKRGSGTEKKVEFTSTISNCCAYQPSRSAARIFFGYQCSTNPGSDQLAVPTRIFPAFVGERFDTHERTLPNARTQLQTSKCHSDPAGAGEESPIMCCFGRPEDHEQAGGASNGSRGRIGPFLPVVSGGSSAFCLSNQTNSSTASNQTNSSTARAQLRPYWSRRLGDQSTGLFHCHLLAILESQWQATECLSFQAVRFQLMEFFARL